MKKKTYKIYTLGCKVNQYDSADLARRLKAIGWRAVDKKAAIAIINTCAVTQTAIRKDRRMINKAKKENPQAKVIIMGCWPQVYVSDVKKVGADMVFGVHSRDKIIKRISGQDSSLAATCQIVPGFVTTSKTRYFLKIQDGCNQFCSYCIIPYTRGRLRSRSQREIIKEAQAAVKAGFAEIVLSGIHLGLYGVDRYKSNRLVELIKEILKIENLGRLRLSSIEVTEISSGLVKLMANNKRLCPHLHIPLQSGSNRILRLMNRPYRRVDFKKKINYLRRLIPKIAITTDVIVGFPGEKEKDFQETYDFIREIKFSRLHVFPFSSHPRTMAAKLPGQVPPEVIEARAKKLRDLGKQLAGQYKKKFINQELEVVVETRCRGRFQGKSAYYFDVCFAAEDIAGKDKIKSSNLIGRLVKVEKWS
jgi:threonylcarbamoyladenosine tRNA methylthiotransferase MtaB